jgi:hypothetical protein
MRTLEQIRASIELQVSTIKLAQSNIDILKQELFDAEFYKVSWEEAEKYFIDKLDPSTSWFNGVIITNENGQTSNVHIRNNEQTHGLNQMWVGGYERHDIFRRGEPFYISREYEGMIPEFKK